MMIIFSIFLPIFLSIFLLRSERVKLGLTLIVIRILLLQGRIIADKLADKLADNVADNVVDKLADQLAERLADHLV